MSKNLDRVKQGYASWHETKGGSIDYWGSMMADPFHFISNDEKQPGLAFSRNRHTRAEAIQRLGAIFDEWEMVHFSPKTYVEQGNDIAMFGSCGYRNKSTGKVAECLIAALWQFEVDEAVSLTEIFDSAVAVSAATHDAAHQKRG